METLKQVETTVKRGPALRELYDWLSFHVHPSYFSISSAQRDQQTDDGESLNLSYFDAERCPFWLSYMFFVMVQSHLTIFQVLREYIESVHPGFIATPWAGMVLAMWQEYKVQDEHWKGFTEGSESQRPTPLNRHLIAFPDRISESVKMAFGVDPP